MAVLDLDYHHGNGTQQLFYERSDVLYVSLHGDPVRAWPYFSGHADETRCRCWRGATKTPLPAGCSDEPYIAALDEALELIARHGAPRLVASVGFDTYRLDAEDLELTNAACEIGGRVAEEVVHTLVLQEGGYYVSHLGRNARQWLRGAEGRRSSRQRSRPEGRRGLRNQSTFLSGRRRPAPGGAAFRGLRFGGYVLHLYAAEHGTGAGQAPDSVTRGGGMRPRPTHAATVWRSHPGMR